MKELTVTWMLVCRWLSLVILVSITILGPAALLAQEVPSVPIVPLLPVTGGHLTIGVNNTWGGAIALIYYDGVGQRNLVAGIDRGMLLQGAAWHVDYHWAAKGLGTDYNEGWEDDASPSGCGTCQPSCGDPSVRFRYNPTQGGADSSPGYACTNPGDNTLSAGISDMLPDGTGISEATVTVISTQEGPGASYISRYVPWRPFGGVYTAVAQGQWNYVTPDSWYQANLWEDATVISAINRPWQPLESGTVDITSKFRLAKQLHTDGQASVPQVWPPTSPPAAQNVDYYVQNRYFGASRLFTQCWAYNPGYSPHDPWGVVLLGAGTQPPLCTLGPGVSWGCWGEYGWVQNGRTPWAPFVMVSDAANSVFAVLYNDQSGPYLKAARVAVFGPNNDQFYVDRDMGPQLYVETLFDNDSGHRVLSTDDWTAPLHSYVIIGPNKQVVMTELARVSNRNWPPNAPAVSGTIAGLPGGTPAAVQVSGSKGNVTVNTDSGSYSVLGLFSGTFTVTPSLAGYTFAPTTRSVTLSSGDVGGQNFTVLSSISGTVTLSTGGALPLAHVTAGTASADTDSNGQYTIAGLAPGTYTVSVSKVGYTFSPTSRSVTVSPNATGQNFTGTAVAGYKISGTIKLVSGTAVPGMSVFLTGGATRETETNTTGYYEFPGLSNGSYTVTPSDPVDQYGFTPASANVTISGANKVQNFTAWRKYGLVGQVVDGDGNGIAGVTFQAGSFTASSDQTGTFRLLGLPAGTYDVRPSPAALVLYSFSPADQVVTLDDGGTPTVVFVRSHR
jgi:hypothetical protein